MNIILEFDFRKLNCNVELMHSILYSLLHDDVSLLDVTVSELIGENPEQIHWLTHPHGAYDKLFTQSIDAMEELEDSFNFYLRRYLENDTCIIDDILSVNNLTVVSLSSDEPTAFIPELSHF